MDRLCTNGLGMQKIIIAGLIFFFSSISVLFAYDKNALRIEFLRNEQRFASPSQAQWYEEEIARVKQESKGTLFVPEKSLTWCTRIHEIARYIPYIFYQLIFLLALLIAAACMFFSWWFLLLIGLLGLLVESEHAWRTMQIKVVAAHEASLYVGPGEFYPVQKKLFYLDELIITQSDHNFSYPQWRYVKYQDTKGWIRYDDNTFS